MPVSIIIPTLDEAAELEHFLSPLQPLRARGHELILVDGGSRDSTCELAVPLVDRLVHADRGRARQMNVGARSASHERLLFLHADTRLPHDALELIESALDGSVWGRFDVRLSGSAPMLRLIGRMMNLRSCITGICTGDQALFMRREAFVKAGGYPDIPLMEDIEISRALKRFGRPACIASPVVTSSRRWEQGGIVRTVLLMWRLRLAHFMGASPDALAKQYRNQR